MHLILITRYKKLGPLKFELMRVACISNESCFFLCVFFVVFLFSLTSLLGLFHSYREEPIGRWGETGVPRENHLTHPQAEHGLSHMWPVRGSNLHQSQR